MRGSRLPIEQLNPWDPTKGAVRMQPEHTPQPWATRPSYPGQEQWAPQAAPTYPGDGTWAGPTQAAHPNQDLWAPQPPAYPGAASPYGWAPADTPPWMVQSSAPPARRGPRKALVIGLVAVVGLLGAGTAGVNAYAKHSICSILEGDSALGGGTADSSSDDGAPTEAEFAKMRDGADELRGYGRMLVFDGDLRSAVNGLAEDVDQLVDVFSSSSSGTAEDGAVGRGFAELMTIAGSVNSHARQAQRACGLPVKGIFDN